MNGEREPADWGTLTNWKLERGLEFFSDRRRREGKSEVQGSASQQKTKIKSWNVLGRKERYPSKVHKYH